MQQCIDTHLLSGWFARVFVDGQVAGPELWDDCREVGGYGLDIVRVFEDFYGRPRGTGDGYGNGVAD